MSNVVIPKEQLSAYERWELSCFADTERISTMPAAPKKQDSLTAGLAQITEKARQEGYAAGLKQGYSEGMANAQQEHGVMQQALSHIAASLQESLMTNHERISQDLLNLSLEVARRMLKSTLQVKRETVLTVVQDAIQSLPYVQQPAKLILNPEDAVLIKQHLDQDTLSAWNIIENPAIERGGCLLETASNQVDASNATRWKRIAEALGNHQDWSDYADE